MGSPYKILITSALFLRPRIFQAHDNFSPTNPSIHSGQCRSQGCSDHHRCGNTRTQIIARLILPCLGEDEESLAPQE